MSEDGRKARVGVDRGGSTIHLFILSFFHYLWVIATAVVITAGSDRLGSSQLLAQWSQRRSGSGYGVVSLKARMRESVCVLLENSTCYCYCRCWLSSFSPPHSLPIRLNRHPIRAGVPWSSGGPARRRCHGTGQLAVHAPWALNLASLHVYGSGSPSHSRHRHRHHHNHHHYRWYRQWPRECTCGFQVAGRE